MNLYKHVVEQPFVFATGLAALVHSTWSLGTLFSGKQPDFGLSFEFIGWIVPAFLIAFALDVGQIATSAEIRAGHRTTPKYATFAVFALATYYLQWLYIAHHMPELALAGGVRESWSALASLVRDAAVWIIPAFLPLSTLMYTFSSDHTNAAPVQESPAPTPPVIVEIVKTAPESLPKRDEQLVIDLQGDSSSHKVVCEACGQWEKVYDNPESAARGLATHLSRHCTARFPVVTTNGNGAHHD